MNIDVNSKVVNETKSSNTSVKVTNTDGSNFKDEILNLSKEQQPEKNESKTDKSVSILEETKTLDFKDENPKAVQLVDELKQNKIPNVKGKQEKESFRPELNLNKQNLTTKKDKDIHVKKEIGSLEDIVVQMNGKVNHTDEKPQEHLKFDPKATDKKDNKIEDDILINNDMNVQDPNNDALKFQMNANMNFNSDGQHFAEFMKDDKNEQKLSFSAKDLAEEEAVLSTMDENILIANQNRAMAEAKSQQVETKVKTVVNAKGIKKVDKKSNVTVETVVKFDEIAMNQNDVDLFAKLVNDGKAEISNNSIKSMHVSKTLADLIAKSMNDNKPIRINFDNNISVIIKISRDGKITADFLPSSQVAEAYLKENLPLLRQRFDDNNIDYDELNQREQKHNSQEDRKKGRKDE